MGRGHKKSTSTRSGRENPVTHDFMGTHGNMSDRERQRMHSPRYSMNAGWWG